GSPGRDQCTHEAHARCSDRLGNVALLERSLNQRHAANASFPEKQQAYRKSSFRTATELADEAEWTEEAIADRQQRMARIAKAIWSMNF
ncbi:MAG: HNH endonuclease family protein, partial [Verrucomicrobiota bacterium]